nr:uncharacterized protein LOC112274160 [Physcomitrium patens]|eukprot:XP_024359165.1 uncharacterized protein LOC112274160 [Physcomitrella patens]
MGALVRLAEVGGHQFNDKDWSTVLDSIRDACQSTQPVELMKPESMVTLGSDLVSGPGRLSIATPPSSMRGGHTPGGQPEAEAEHSVAHENGAVEGTPKSVSNGDASKMNRRLSFDSVAEERVERLSIAESEGFEAPGSVACPREAM